MGSETIFVLPGLYIISVWLLLLYPSRILPIVPSLPFLTSRSSLSTFLPLHPSTMYESYRLGVVEGQLAILDSRNDEVSRRLAEDLLAKEATYFSRPSITREEMRKVEADIKEYESDRGVVQKVRGLFSFINLVWFASICGICLAVGPVLYMIASPLVSLLVSLFTEVIIPLLLALKPLYELLAYIICYLFIANGLRINPETGFFISLTGALLFIPSFLYSTYLHSTGGGNIELFSMIFNFFLASQFVPLAILFQSTFLGFLASICVYSILGFSVVCTGLSYYLGFQKDHMGRVIVASIFFMVLLVVVKIKDIPAYYLGPFTTGLMTMGSVTYFLACLILSSAFYYSPGIYDRKAFFWNMQLLFIVSLGIAVFFGSVYNIAPLLNTACTYAVFYAMEKIVEFGPRFDDAFWFYILGGSITLYMISLYLHNHPGFIVSMVDGNWILK